jgi:hypothetical protein
MSKSYRIKTTPGVDNNGFLKVNVDLNQNYDFLEVLSLKISQKDEYQNFCADYGVVAGRVIINGGFGVPNVKVSIFVPVDEKDLEDPVKSALYNYQEPFPDQKNKNGVRYNLLPKNQQTLDHTPVGTFPKKREILDDSTTLEIYEKYYKYTTTTNEAGDYILFGVPVGEHFLHYDMDVSDIGFLSTRPFDLINKGYSDDLFSSRFKFNGSNNLDSLPQIFSENIPVTVEPYWCDSLSVGSALGINRVDIEPNVEIIPNSVFMGSVFSDDEKDSLNKNCKPSREMGKMNEVITGAGKIEAIRRNSDGSIEKFNFKEDSIDDNGNWSVLVPMNLRKVVTDEFGNLVPSPDGIKGVATEGDYRFRVSMDATSNDKRLRQRAKFLVPNTNNNFVFDEFSPEELENTILFNKNEQLSTVTTGTPYEDDLRNQYNYLEEFYTFRWKKVYTVKQYIGRMQKARSDEARGFIGIKDIFNAEGVNKFPSNRFDTNTNVLYGILCLILSLFGNVVGFINGALNIINGLVTLLCQIKIPIGLKIQLVYCFRIGVTICNQNYRNNFCADGPGTSPRSNCNSGCNKCRCANQNETNETITQRSNCGSGTKEPIFNLSIQLKYRCLLGPVFCKKCKASCPEGQTHSCCPVIPNGENAGSGCETPNNSYVFGCPCKKENLVGESERDSVSCCSDCCVKIPLIPLRCAEEDLEIRVSHIPTPFAPVLCNQTFVAPYSCVNCGGLQTPGVKDWVACVLEPVANFLKMLKFDFYNDWVGGTLYFPLIKRKYKLKKSKRKFGQIKKDKFCDFECRIRNSNTFQGDPTYNQWRIKIPSLPFSNPTISIGGCTAKIKGKRVTEWYGTPENEDETDNLNLAVQEIKFEGVTPSQDGCVITFNEFSQLQNVFNGINSNIDLVKNREVSGTHGKPEYVETEDPSGFSSWENIGGHGHHRNICDNTRMLERKEFFKTTLDCTENIPQDDVIADNYLGGSDGNFEEPLSEKDNGQLFPQPGDFCDDNNCTPSCSSNGVAPCKDRPIEYDNYADPIIEHGLISWYEGEIYYTPYMKPGDPKENSSEYKANILMPTTVMELGSMSYCDIDDVPFIMDQLEPTTFQVSVEEYKYKGNPNSTSYTDPNSGISGNKIEVLKLEDKKNSSLNLRAYVEFGCFTVVCSNINAAVNQSQIGVDMVDKNDIGIEAGNCFVRFDHDEDIREYFCRRFNGYKGDRTFHHIRPGGVDTDNIYNTYPEITVLDGSFAGDNVFYELPNGGGTVLSEFNDSDSFISGDACGYKKENGNPDYFYGLAPGATGQFINYPNGNNSLNFGTQQILDDVNDDDNFEENVTGIRFNRSQTPYHLYFGLVPGKTALHKTVAKFFADKINAITLQGLGASNSKVEENINNTPNINGGEDNNFTVFKTCLGETLLQQVDVGEVQQFTNNGINFDNVGNNSGGGTSTGGGVGTGGSGSSGPGGTSDYVLSYTDPSNGTIYPDVNNISITNGACTTTTPTEIRDFTLEVNSLPTQINVSLWGGDGGSPDCFPPGPSELYVNVFIDDGNGGPINNNITPYPIPVQSLPNPNQLINYPISTIGTYQGRIEVFPFYRNTFNVTLTIS